MAIGIRDVISNDDTRPNIGTEYSIIACKSQGQWFGKTAVIGTQTWMAENLRVTHYRDGTPINFLTFYDNDWTTDTTGAASGWGEGKTLADPPALFQYDNDCCKFELTHGFLYNWYAVTHSSNLAPEGWHIPTETEFETLHDYVNDLTDFSASVGNPGAKLAGSRYAWESADLTDHADFGITQFKAQPGGMRMETNSWSLQGQNFRCWSSTENNATTAVNASILSNSTDFDIETGNKAMGLVVRCIKDS